MNGLNFNYNNGYNRFDYPVKQESQAVKKQHTNADKASLAAAPVYTEVPYGIVKRDYVKLGVKTLPSGDEVHIYKLQNGQKVGIIKGGGCPIIQTYVGVGSFDETDGKNGISHLIEHSLFHSSKKYDDIEKAIKDIGGYSNANTGTGSTQYFISLSDDNFDTIEKAIDIEADMIYNPTFTKLDKEKPIVTQEIHEYLNRENNIIMSKLNKILLSCDNDKTSDIIGGSPETIRSVTIDDIFAYHSSYYVPSNCTTFIKSSIEPDELIKTVASKFNEASKDVENLPVKKRSFANFDGVKRFDFISKEKNSKELNVGFNLASLPDSKEKIKVRALIQLLSMRMNIGGYLSDEYDNAQSAVFCEESDTLNEYASFKELCQGFSDVLLSPPNEFELSEIKNKLLNDAEEDFQSSESLAHFVCSELYNNTDFNDNQIIENLSAEDIIDALKYFNINSCAMGVVHPRGTTKEQIEEDYNKNKNSTIPVTIPKITQPIDISKRVSVLNIEPYSSRKVYCATLDDNTRFTAIDSNSDKCEIVWYLSNRDLDKHNITAKYVLDNMYAKINSYDKYTNTVNNALTTGYHGSDEGFEFRLSCKYDKLDETVRTLKKYFDIDFNEKDFEAAKKEALSEIDSLKEEAFDMYKKDYYGRGCNLNPDELRAELEKLTLEDLKRYYNDVILNSSSTVAVSAPINDNPEVLNKIASAINIPLFSFKKENQEKNTYKQNEKSICYINTQQTGQNNFGKIYSFKTTGNPEDNVKFKILNSVLSKRIFDRIREKDGLSYTPYSSIITQGNTSSIIFDTTSNCDNKGDVEKIFNAFDEITKELMAKPVTKEELDYAKKEYNKRERKAFENQSDAIIKIACDMLSPSGLFGLQNNFKTLEKITPDDVQKAALYAFNQKPVYLVNANEKLIAENKEFFSTLGEIKEK